MTEPAVRDFLERVLDAIEEREGGLLVWGAVDGSFLEAELHALIDPLLDAVLEQDEDFGVFEAKEAISQLVARGWIVEVPQPDGPPRYRSRMAETVRLLTRLRQLFPKHARVADGWQAAPTLVADFRFLRRRRRYPRRDVPASRALARIGQEVGDQLALQACAAFLESSAALRVGGLAEFQVRAASRVLRSIEAKKPWPTIICAGTGSGKTLAFYLPAIASAIRHRLDTEDERAWVKAVAIYPRNELLKDQLREVFGRIDSLATSSQGQRLPRLRVGAFFGDVPRRAGTWPKSWRSAGPHRTCPFLRCLRCNGDLLWREEDFSRGRERLVCRTEGCGFATTEDQIALTRDSLAARPPDILFCNAEILNRQLSNSRSGHLFGIGPRAIRPPELVLLDEVHTYESRYGAQIAYLLRRWQHLVGQRLRFVGLSATLREAPRFFAELIGSRTAAVAEISPRSDEMESEGAEYMVALRGDPVSRTALLSATIQTAMLLERCLDKRPRASANSVSEGLFGTRTFVFTDNLDVVNRLYYNLLDAEGRRGDGSPDLVKAPTGGLAALRQPGSSRIRYLAGQDWISCKRYGHDLADRLVIRRVTSQDRGFDPNADIVVATAALEVGFDDPHVGAVIQHKAPRSMAGFLQRKGRAGRTRGMRPWTVVVVSDYGRDRVAYQGYDTLFDPELPVRTLPLRNRYITRMQSTYALLDFLSTRMPSGLIGSVWNDLATPDYGSDRRRELLIKEVRELLESESSTAELASYLARALQLEEEEVSALLWEYPRPLMTSVLPTALRRLETKWRGEVAKVDEPLPEFIPSLLFSDLEIPEVRIDLERRSTSSEPQYMGFFAALKEFSPGRVSRRFGFTHELDRDWIAPPDSMFAGAGPHEMDVQSLGQSTPAGVVEANVHVGRMSVPVFRPVVLRTAHPPRNVGDTSSSRLDWQVQFAPFGDGVRLDAAFHSGPRSPGIKRAVFYLHANHSPVEVRRFATSFRAEVVSGTTRHLGVIQFVCGSGPAAIGASFAADAVAFDLDRFPELHTIASQDESLGRALRTLRFTDAAWRGDTLALVSNAFQREWLAQIQLSAITYEAIHSGVTLQEAAERLASGTATVSRVDVLAALFQSHVVEDGEEDIGLNGEDRLRQELQTLLLDQAVSLELDRMSAQLWQPINEEWDCWLSEVLHATVGAAVLRAINDICPEIDTENVVVDLEAGGKDQRRVWISERSPGGNGQIEQLMRVYSEDPRRFLSMVRAAAGTGEREVVDAQLKRFVSALTDSSQHYPSTTAAVAAFREAATHGELADATRNLRRSLVREGISPFHGFMTAAMSRVLRANAGPLSDAFLADSIRRWDTEERRLGIEIDVRIVSYWLSRSDEIDEVARSSGVEIGGDRGAWRFGAVYGLLWGRGRVVREAPLRFYHPFSESPPVERLLAIAAMKEAKFYVSVADEGWLEIASKQLASGQLVTLTCESEQSDLMSDALNILICNPVDCGYLRAYARMQGLRRSADRIEADVELIEALQ